MTMKTKNLELMTSDLCVKSLFIQEKVFKAEEVDDRQRTFVASSNSIDADGEIVEQDFNLERFKANPVILFAHKSRELPIGKATNIDIVDDKLQMDIVFASEKANPLAEQVFQSVKEGTLKAVSIGFRPGEVRLEKRNDKDVFVFSKNEIFETSITPIPSNPDALAKMKAKARKSTNAPTGENEDDSMNEKEFKALQSKLASLESGLEDERAKTATLKERNEVVEAELKSLKEENQKLTLGSIEAQIDELVGVKIAPTEKASLVKMALKAPEIFEEHMKAIQDRPDMQHLKGSGMPPEPKQLPAATDEGFGGSALEAFVQNGAFGN